MKNKTILVILAVVVILGAAYFLKNNNVLVKYQQFCNEQKATYPRNSTDQKTWDDYNKCQPVSAYFNKDVTQEQIGSSIKQIKEVKGVYKVEYISKEEAAQKNRTDATKANPLLGELSPGKEFFPSSLLIYVSNPETKEDVIKTVQNLNLFQLVQ